MSANTLPIYPLTPNVSWCTVRTGNSLYNGTGSVDTAFTAGANGSRVDKIIFKSLGSNSNITVARIFIFNNTNNAIETNNSLIVEQNLPITSSSNSSVTSEITLEYTDLFLQAGYKLNVTLATSVVDGWEIIVFGGDY